MKPNKPPRKQSPADESRDDSSSASKSGSSLLWILLAGGALLFCVLPIFVGAIVGALYWIKPAPGDQGAEMKPDAKKAGMDAKNEKPGVIAERIRFSADFAKAGNARRIERTFLSGDGRRVAVTNLDKTQTWDIAGEPKKLQEFVGYCEAISPDGKRVIINRIKDRVIVHAETGADIASVGTSGNVHFTDDKLVWSFRGPVLGNPARLTRIDSATGQGQDKFIAIPALDSTSGNVVYLNSKGELFCFIAQFAEVHVWDVNTEKWTRKTPLKLAPGERIGQGSPTTFSSDGRWVVTETGTISPYNLSVFDTTTGEGINLGKEYDARKPVFVPGRDLLLVSKFEAPGRYLRPACDVKSKAVVGAFGPIESTASTAVSADGNTLAVGTGGGQVLIWDIRKLK